MNNRVLAAIRSQPWAILPEYLDVIEAIAMRVHDNPSVTSELRAETEERRAEAIVEMGQKFPGARSAAIKGSVGSLPLFGPIFPRANVMTDMSGATSLAALAADFRALDASPQVRNILIVADSPGGQITDVRAFARMVADATKPVTVFVSGLCASAAYHIASQANTIIADPFGIVGSLGVMVSGSYQEAPDMQGRRDVSIVSSNAPNKNPDLSTEEGQATIRELLDGLEAVFLSDVAKGRGVSLDAVKSSFGRGGTMSAQQAEQAGLIDRVEPNGLRAVLDQLAGPVSTATPRRAAAAQDLAQLRAEFQNGE